MPRWCSRPRTPVPGRGRAGRRPSWWTGRGGWPTGCAGRSARDAVTPTWWPVPTTASASRRSWSSARTRSAPSPWSGPRWCTRRRGAGALYVSCATPGTQALAGRSAGGRHRSRRSARRRPRTVLPGSATAAVKDPVIRHDGRQWHLWASVHPLDDPDGHRPHDHRARHQRRRRDLAVARHRTRRHRGQLGRPRGALRRGGARRRRGRGRSTTAGPPPRRTGRSGPGSRSATATAASPPSGTRPCCTALTRPSACGTPTSWPCRAAGHGWFYEATRADGAHELRTVLTD